MRKYIPFLIAAAAQLTLSVSVMADNIAVTTFHYNSQRTGWNSRETILTPANVKSDSFGLRWRTNLHADVAGSPLYVPNVEIAGSTHDVVYAATTGNNVYALDSSDGHILWGPTHVANAVNDVAFVGNGDLKHPNGILSTPAIDLASKTIYVCALFQPKIQQQFGIWAIDITTGKIKPGWPVIIHGSYLGCRFNGGQILQRGALLLDTNDWLYIPFGARQDRPDWHGWIVGVNTRSPKSPLQLWSPDPDAEGGGIWGVGGPSADTSGNVFVVMGNGGNNFAHHGVDIGQSVVLLPLHNGKLLPVYDNDHIFMPKNVQYLNDTDEDLGGGGGVLLPHLTLSNGVKTSSWDLITTGGKEGVVYLLDQHHLGGIGHSLYQKLYFGNPSTRDLGEIRAVPAYFDSGANGQYLFYPGEDPGVDGEHALVCLKLGLSAAGLPNLTQIWTLPSDLQRPASPVVTSNGASDAIVWLTEPDLTKEGGIGPGTLHAYDAATGKQLYSSNEVPDRDALQNARKFASPTVSNGKVFVGIDGIACYGLLVSRSAGVAAK